MNIQQLKNAEHVYAQLSEKEKRIRDLETENAKLRSDLRLTENKMYSYKKSLEENRNERTIN